MKDILPPCFTPLEIVKDNKIHLSNLMYIFWWKYHIANNLATME